VRALILASLAFLGGCGAMGLVEIYEDSAATDLPNSTDDGDEAGGGAAMSTSIAGELYAIDPADIEVIEPPGLAASFSELLDRDVLFYVAGEDETRIRIDLALAAADGSQDPCESVLELPTADWSEQPRFQVGPGQLDVSFGGHPATLRQLVLTGTFAADGSGWSGGTMSAEADARELAPAVGDGVDVCALVEGMGGDCHACDDGAPQCFTLAFDQVSARRSSEAFDPAPACDE
jgi:hypothetical protein